MPEQDKPAVHNPSQALQRPLSAQVRRVLRVAGEEARRLQHSFVGNEHLALAFLATGGRAAGVLSGLGMNLEALRLRIQTVKGSGGAPFGGAPRLNPHVERALAFAGDEARKANHAAIGVENLLVGMARDESLFGGLLADLGVEIGSVRQALHARTGARGLAKRSAEAGADAAALISKRYEDARSEAATIIGEPLAAIRGAQRSVTDAVDRAVRRGQREAADRLRAAGDRLQEISELLSSSASTVEPG